MTFLPTGPISVSLAVVIWLVAAHHMMRGDWKLRMVGLTLILSWVFARTTTATEDPSYLVVGYTLCCGICLYVGTRTALAIASLYAIRLILLPVVLLIAPTVEAFWLWYWDVNLVPLMAQIIIAIGASSNGNRSRNRRVRLDPVRPDRRNTSVADMPKARGMRSKPTVGVHSVYCKKNHPTRKKMKH